MNTAALLISLLLAAPARESSLRDAARVVVRYLDAVRLAAPRAADRSLPHAAAYADATRLVAPRALAELEAAEARGAEHALAFWRQAARGRVLETFQLVAVRRAPGEAAVVTVEERLSSRERAALVATRSEYLVARIDAEWRVVARRPGGQFDDAAVAALEPYWR
ncbi:MAG TPA: hypothetical protein VM753_11720 [Anaeromyxobacter sp.]|jgi:hypothetical protein|nr:hypothetical protein [Anaeromyxobacter sp.]